MTPPQCQHLHRECPKISPIYAVDTFDIFRFYTTCCVCVHAKIRSYTSGDVHSCEDMPKHVSTILPVVSWEERLMRILDIFVQVQNNHLPVLRPVTHRISLEEEPDVKVIRVQ